jgi:5-methylcytosine-specific restriction protein A
MPKPSGLPTASDFEREIRARWAQSSKQGAPQLEIKAGALHRHLGGYPAPHGNHRMPDCCQAMKRLMRDGDAIVHTPKKGQGASLVIRYVLPRADD